MKETIFLDRWYIEQMRENRSERDKQTIEIHYLIYYADLLGFVE